MQFLVQVKPKYLENRNILSSWHFVYCTGLSAKLHVRYSQLGQLPHQTRSGPRQVSSEAVSSEAVSSEAVSSEVVSSEAVSSEVVSSEAVSSCILIANSTFNQY